MVDIEERQLCRNCVAVKPLNRYIISSTGQEVVTLFCRTWGTYVHDHDAEKCLSFILNFDKNVQKK